MADETKKLDQLRIIRDSLVFRYLPNPDDMIVRTPRGLLTYDDMLADSRIGSLFLDRRNGTTNLPVYITDTEDKRINEYRDPVPDRTAHAQVRLVPAHRGAQVWVPTGGDPVEAGLRLGGCTSTA